jgi:toxin ParE1/3/4
MKRFTLSPEAALDIRDIWAYIAHDSIRAARRVRLQIMRACQTIAANPRLGHSRSDLTDKPVLFWPVRSYLIIYNPGPRPIEIVRVLHGALDALSRLSASS